MYMFLWYWKLIKDELICLYQTSYLCLLTLLITASLCVIHDYMYIV